MQPFLPLNKYYILCVCVCSLRYPACNSQVLYCHLWPIRFYSTFPIYPIKRKIFYTLMNIICIIWFYLQDLSEQFLNLRRIHRDTSTNGRRFSCKLNVLQTLQILGKFEFFRQNFKKYSNIKFHKNLSSGSRVVPCGRRDRHRDTTNLIDTFRNSVKANKVYASTWGLEFPACLRSQV